MHNYALSIVLNFSIAIAAVLAAIRFKFVVKSFRPFMYFIWLGLANEMLSIILIKTHGSNAVNGNIFVLLEFFLILWQFYVWNFDTKRKYIFIAALGVLAWITDNFFLNTIAQNNSMFREFYSFVVVVFSIYQVNKVIIFQRGNVLTNARFIISVTFLFYYACKTFVENFNAFHLGITPLILQEFWIIMYFVNAISNVVYAIAILCMPTMEEFILPY